MAMTRATFLIAGALIVALVVAAAGMGAYVAVRQIASAADPAIERSVPENTVGAVLHGIDPHAVAAEPARNRAARSNPPNRSWNRQSPPARTDPRSRPRVPGGRRHRNFAGRRRRGAPRPGRPIRRRALPLPAPGGLPDRRRRQSGNRRPDPYRQPRGGNSSRNRRRRWNRGPLHHPRDSRRQARAASFRRSSAGDRPIPARRLRSGIRRVTRSSLGICRLRNPRASIPRRSAPAPKRRRRGSSSSGFRRTP